MSQVLIGIIGVILFIGLALAGALYLGDNFQQASNNSKGSATVQAVSQIASAANMANVDTGIPIYAGSPPVNLTPTGSPPANYLKSVPVNPVAGGGAATFADANGNVSGPLAGLAASVIMKVPSSTICAAIARQSGQQATDVSTGLAAMPQQPSGCFMASAAIGNGIAANDFVAFAKI